MSLIWWEKTVEYHFIYLRMVEEGKLFCAPLSGKAESSLGDLVLGKDFRFVLIEFKRTIFDLGSEKNKYYNFEFAKSEFLGRSNHHKCLFGLEIKSRFSVGMINYFYRDLRSETMDTSSIFTYGEEREKFNGYLLELLRFRKADRRSGSGAFSPEELQNVCGVTPEGNAITMSLQEYCKECMPELYSELTSEYSNTESEEKTSSDSPSPS